MEVQPLAVPSQLSDANDEYNWLSSTETVLFDLFYILLTELYLSVMRQHHLAAIWQLITSLSCILSATHYILLPLPLLLLLLPLYSVRVHRTCTTVLDSHRNAECTVSGCISLFLDCNVISDWIKCPKS